MTTDGLESRRRPIRAELEDADVVEWARQVPGPVDLGEAEARLILRDERLVGAVRGTSARRRDAAARAERAAGPAHRRIAGWVLCAVLVLLPALPLLLAPGRRFGRWFTREQAALFFDVTAVCSTLMCLVLAALLIAGIVRPGRLIGPRLAAAGATAAMGVILPLFLLVVGVFETPDGWQLRLIPYLLALALALATLKTLISRRHRRHHLQQDLEDVRQRLRADADAAEQQEGARGPVRELRRVIRRLPRLEQEGLDRDRQRVLEALRRRGAISEETAVMATELPLGRWHELDR
ncbi:hypothetical protein BF93_10825 [Brachybacterium phenoliresistens]|uniref:Uncharacterized protein n=1 Tax=Brachybacterium phenoliresistens TaxID=396014 RepID=Z9JWR4_9MICO|nr:hypothetical protein [Brachybacterium phenoliresistens]EWS82443.1 hypothetical protein BF93_10825 [Brachybacterium phenoliresistens]